MTYFSSLNQKQAKNIIKCKKKEMRILWKQKKKEEKNLAKTQSTASLFLVCTLSWHLFKRHFHGQKVGLTHTANNLYTGYGYPSHTRNENPTKTFQRYSVHGTHQNNKKIKITEQYYGHTEKCLYMCSTTYVVYAIRTGGISFTLSCSSSLCSFSVQFTVHEKLLI